MGNRDFIIIFFLVPVTIGVIGLGISEKDEMAWEDEPILLRSQSSLVLLVVSDGIRCQRDCFITEP